MDGDDSAVHGVYVRHELRVLLDQISHVIFFPTVDRLQCHL